ncbi:hypothetical protein DBV05_g2566 [Lasiodiplodia theobromae]|uniref:Aminodeoxychorismate lyase n=1 Tax=Lasiodiplodia theobromae TaxID=45133 RepID=A0A5N5DLE0_9PEZI|nr:hypothetical protein DBV05_g2566 [Lasiodiplodia theobromae]
MEPTSFSLFTSLRHDPALRSSPENSSDVVSFSPSSPFYMLRYHRDRMLEASQHFGWAEVSKKLTNGEELESLLNEQVESWRGKSGDAESPLKVRVLFNRSGEMHTDIITTPGIPLSSLYPATFTTPPSSNPPSKQFIPSPKTGGALLLGPDDSLATSSPKSTWILTIDTAPTPTSPHTLLKTTHRAHYDAARARSVPAAPTPAGNLHEVLLWNSVGEMTEGSFTSAYFYRGGRWVTPPVGVPNNVSSSSEKAGGEDKDAEGEREGTVSQQRSSCSKFSDEGELREPFPGRWGHSIRSVKAVAGAGGQRGTTRRWALKKGLCMEEPVARETVEVGEWVWVSNGVRGFGLGRVVETKKVD